MKDKIGWKETFVIVRRIWSYSGNLKFFCILATIGCSFAPLFYSFTNSYLYQLFVNLCTTENKSTVFHSMKLLLLVLVVAILIFTVCFMIIFQTNVKVRGIAKKKAYIHTMNLQESNLNASSIGDLMTRITNDLDNAFELIGYTLLGYDNPFSMIITIIGTYIIIFQRNWILANISLLLAAINLLVVNHYILPLQKKESSVRKSSAEAGQVIVNTLSGIVEARTFGFQQLLKDRFTNKAEEIYQSNVSIIRKKTNILLAAAIQNVVSIVGIMLIGLYMVQKGYLDVATAIFIVNMQTTLSNTAAKFGERVANVQKNLVSGKRFLNFMDGTEETEREDRKLPNNKSVYAIELKDITFHYKDTDNTVLNHINIQIKNGEKVALVGSSGGGKTTLFRLLLNFESTDEGLIKIMGNDVKDYSIRTLRKMFSYVPQDCYLFNGTIRENILMGNPAATADDISQVIKKSCLKDWIDTLENGIDTEIGEGGSKLSGGQKQRIAIARAMLKDSPIILLDEATSSLDSSSEEEVKNAFIQLMENRTCITIAHRLSTIKESDQIIVLEKGEIVERGNHNSLLKQKGRYAELYQMQFV